MKQPQLLPSPYLISSAFILILNCLWVPTLAQRWPNVGSPTKLCQRWANSVVLSGIDGPPWTFDPDIGVPPGFSCANLGAPHTISAQNQAPLMYNIRQPLPGILPQNQAPLSFLCSFVPPPRFLPQICPSCQSSSPLNPSLSKVGWLFPPLRFLSIIFSMFFKQPGNCFCCSYTECPKNMSLLWCS